MQIIITGGGGFLGQMLAKSLIAQNFDFDELTLVDIVKPAVPARDDRIICQQLDLSEPGAAASIINSNTGILFHLAGVLSSQSEKDFDLGMKVNLDITRQLLEACRQCKPGILFVFTSSLAVYGGALPEIVNDATALTPLSSYGTQKAMSELLVNDYSRKNFVDGRVLRLPTICIRPGRPNQAASSFISSIIREPLNGEPTFCPVSPELPVWISSPDTVIHNLVHSAEIEASAFGSWRSVNLPGYGIIVKEMLQTLENMAGQEVRNRVQFKTDQHINNIVSSWPGRIDNSRALKLGFKVDTRFEDFITQYLSTQPLKD